MFENLSATLATTTGRRPWEGCPQTSGVGRGFGGDSLEPGRCEFANRRIVVAKGQVMAPGQERRWLCLVALCVVLKAISYLAQMLNRHSGGATTSPAVAGSNHRMGPPSPVPWTFLLTPWQLCLVALTSKWKGDLSTMYY